jgi:thioredoxin 1
MGQFTFEVTDNNFQDEVMRSNQPVLVDFWADWCGPCKMIAPLVDELAKKYEGRLRVGKLDVDMNGNTPQMFDIQGIPTLLLFKNGALVHRIVGYRPKDKLELEILPYLEVEPAK